ncbi:MAG: nucleolar RNA-binding Nop10p family protein [Natrialbaceae archaeon]|nr:nucleolar RNA-binding Nop10p family protein [Natrialbaceae archaeon]
MRSSIRVCSDWETAHDRPRYTLGEDCPDCGAPAVNSARHHSTPPTPTAIRRRALKRRSR